MQPEGRGNWERYEVTSNFVPFQRELEQKPITSSRYSCSLGLQFLIADS